MENQNERKEETKQEEETSRRHSRRSSDRNRERDRDRDAKAKGRARRSHGDPSAVTPGAVSEKDGDDSLTASKRSSDRSLGSSSRRRSDRDRDRDGDAKSKARARRSGSGAAKPGAVAESNDGGDLSSSKRSDRSIGSSRRSDRDRDRDAKARARRHGSGAATPGAVAETSDSREDKGDRDSRSKARARRHGSGAATPGVVAERNDDSRENARRRKEGRSGSGRTVDKNRDSGEDRDRERRRKLKEKEAAAAVTPRSGSDAAAAAPEEEVPTAAAIDDIEGEEGAEYAVHGSLVAPEAPPVRTAPMTAAPFGSDEYAAAPSTGEGENKAGERPAAVTPFYCKAWFWLAVVFMIIVGVVAAIFLLRSGDSNDTGSNPAPVDPTSGSPTTDGNPSPPAPTTSPTVDYIYDPPSKADCEAIASNQPLPLLGQESNFTLKFEVTRSKNMALTGDQVNQLAVNVQEYILPSLVGCNDISTRRALLASTTIRRGLRRLYEKWRYAISYASVQGQRESSQSCVLGKNNCRVVDMDLSLILKGKDVEFIALVGLIEESLSSTSNDNLVNLLQLDVGVFEDVKLSQISEKVRQTTAPSKNPTVAPVSGPSPPPSASPTRMLSLSPSGLPTTQPSPSPTLAPFPGPSPPPTPSPTKTPTVSPTPSPTKTPTVSPTPSPTKRPTESPTPSPTKRPTKSPTQNPTTPQPVTPAPTKLPSVVPTIAPTDRPTFAFDGHGVPVYGDWDNKGTGGVDVGKYFLWIASDWEAVFGSLPPVAETATYYYAEQRRNDGFGWKVIWQGQVCIWDFNVAADRTKNAIPDGFEQGRRNPISSSANGQWQTGDIIVPRYVSPNVDWRNAFNSGTLASQGVYFLFKWEDWETVFGYDPRPEHQQTDAIICRNGQQVKSTQVQTFKEQGREGGYMTGRLVSASAGDFEGGDYLLPPGMACPEAIRPRGGSVFVWFYGSYSPKEASYGVEEGRFFFFDLSSWEQAFEFPSWGDCSDEATCSISGTIDKKLAYFVVRQCREDIEIWNGIVATSVNHFLYPDLDTARGVGRRHRGANGDFNPGDTIVPFSRSCS